MEIDSRRVGWSTNEWMNHQNGKRVPRYVGTMDMPFHEYTDY